MQESGYEDTRDIPSLRQIGAAIDLMSRFTPWQSKCLVQAITGKILLRRQRLENTLYLGVASNPQKSNPQKSLTAHAWLRSGPCTVTGALDQEKYTVVAKFADLYGES